MALRRALLSLRPNVSVARAFGTAPTGPITVADRSIDVTVVVDGIHRFRAEGIESSDVSDHIVDREVLNDP